VLNLFQANDDSRRFRLMRGQLRKLRVAPISKAHYLSLLSFHSRNFEQLQHAKSSVVEKEGMMPKHVAELRDCRVILSKHLRPKLSQRLAYLPFVQLHCQSAFNFDPSSASNFDPFVRRGLAVALVSSELAGIAETRRARVA